MVPFRDPVTACDFRYTYRYQHTLAHMHLQKKTSLLHRIQTQVWGPDKYKPDQATTRQVHTVYPHSNLCAINTFTSEPRLFPPTHPNLTAVFFLIFPFVHSQQSSFPNLFSAQSSSQTGIRVKDVRLILPQWP